MNKMIVNIAKKKKYKSCVESTYPKQIFTNIITSNAM